MILTHIGQTACDMHGRNFTFHDKLSTASIARPGAPFEIRNPIEFAVDDVGSLPGSHRLFIKWLDAATHGRGYMNKLLITVAWPNDEDGWWTCAYCYDGTRAGICQLREV